MKKNTLLSLAESLNRISVFITVIALVRFFLGNVSIRSFICASFLFLLSGTLKLMTSSNKKLKYLGMVLTIAVLVLSAYYSYSSFVSMVL